MCAAVNTLLMVFWALFIVYTYDMCINKRRMRVKKKREKSRLFYGMDIRYMAEWPRGYTQPQARVWRLMVVVLGKVWAFLSLRLPQRASARGAGMYLLSPMYRTVQYITLHGHGVCVSVVWVSVFLWMHGNRSHRRRSSGVMLAWEVAMHFIFSLSLSLCSPLTAVVVFKSRRED